MARKEDQASVPLAMGLAAVWCILAILQSILSLAFPWGILRIPLLSVPARLSLHSLEISLLAGVVAIAGGSLVWIHRRCNRRIPRPVRILAVWIVLLPYAACWATFASLGYFLDIEGTVYWMENFVQFVQHLLETHAVGLVLFPLMVLIAAYGLADLLPAWLRRRGPVFRRRFIWGTGIGVVTSIVLSLAGALAMGDEDVEIFEPETGVTYRESEYYRLMRDYGTGPFLRTFAAIRGRGAVILHPADVPVRRDPRISPSEFARGIEGRGWNVIVILVESLRRDQLRAFGCDRDVMPAVNRLAAEGMVFTSCYTQASHSDYADICPLTSLYPLRSESRHRYEVDPTYPRCLIYDVLKPMGYRTAIFSSQNENWGYMFNYLDSGTLDRFLHSATYQGEVYVPPSDRGLSRWLKGKKPSGKIDDRLTVDAAIEWIREGEAPFFIYMNLQNSHVPYRRPGDFPARFGPETVDFVIALGDLPPDKVEIVKDIYADSLAYVDAQIERLLDHLKETGRWERTIVVVTADTGQAFYEHGFAGHGRDIYDEIMHVPLILRAPGLKPGVDDRLAQHVDVPPTVFGLLGIPPYPGFQGRDLLAAEDGPRSAYLLCQSPLAEQYGIVRDGWKLIHDLRRRRCILYNLETDPDEKRDLSAVHPDVVEELRGRLHAWVRHQIDYYDAEERHSAEFAPVLED